MAWEAAKEDWWSDKPVQRYRILPANEDFYREDSNLYQFATEEDPAASIQTRENRNFSLAAKRVKWDLLTNQHKRVLTAPANEGFPGGNKRGAFYSNQKKPKLLLDCQKG